MRHPNCRQCAILIVARHERIQVTGAIGGDHAPALVRRYPIDKGLLRQPEIYDFIGHQRVETEEVDQIVDEERERFLVAGQ